jgi:hypothetical protein
MKKRWVAFIAVLSLALGVGCASWYWLYFYTQFKNYWLVARTQADIVTKVAVLEHIRAGRIPDATNLLETLLDGELISAAALALDGTKFTPNTGQAVALEMKARAVSGYAPIDEDVRGAIQDAFRLISAFLKAGRRPTHHSTGRCAMKPRSVRQFERYA